MAEHTYLTRFTYEFTSFQGWRFSICRGGQRFIQYFSDREYGSPEAAEAEATRLRDDVLQALAYFPENPGKVFDLFRRTRQRNAYPPGLIPLRGPHPQPDPETTTKVISLRAGHPLQHILIKTANTLEIDIPSLLRLSIYMFTAWLGTHPHTAKDLHPLIQALEDIALPTGLPPFAEFASTRHHETPPAQI